jgi:hypothetical protein
MIKIRSEFRFAPARHGRREEAMKNEGRASSVTIMELWGVILVTSLAIAIAGALFWFYW